MNPLKRLAGQTVVYGLSSIVGRFLNYLLVPLHTNVFSTDQYGIIGEMYSYVAFLVVLLTYGMETSFFRFWNKQDGNEASVYKTAVFSLLASSGIFILLSHLQSRSIADWLHYPNHSEYVTWFAIIVGLDAVSSLPLARLRASNKAVRFAKINLINVAINIGLNVFFIGYCIPTYENGGNFITHVFYAPSIGVGYVFIANLIASIVKFALVIPVIRIRGGGFSVAIWKQMMSYGLPMLFLGLAGIVNETIDRIMLKRILIHERGELKTMATVGIYSAVYKISIVMLLFLQAFRYAAEPFFFSEEKSKDAKKTYSKVMTYFVIVMAGIFLSVMLFLDVVKYFIHHDYWEGLHVVPVLLLANIFLGVYYNQSIWYKLTDKTMYGAYIAGIGAFITIVLNWWLIPIIDYTGSAWATFFAYGTMMVLSYIWGQRHYPVRYNLKKIIFYMALSLLLYGLALILDFDGGWLHYLIRFALIGIFLFAVYILEWPTKKTGQ